MPRIGKQGSRSSVQITAPPNVPTGIVRAIDNPKYEFKTPLMYPPVPIKRAPPRQTIPTKLAKKSKIRASSAKMPIMHITLCQYSGRTKGIISSPKIKISLGASKYVISRNEEIAYIPPVRTFIPRSNLSLRLASNLKPFPQVLFAFPKVLRV